MRRALLSVALFGLVAGGCQYEFRSTEDQPIYVADGGTVKALYVCKVREYTPLLDSPEASNYAIAFLLESPPETGAKLRSTVSALPRYRRLDGDGRRRSLYIGVDCVWLTVEPKEMFPEGNRWETRQDYILSTDPFVLAIGPRTDLQDEKDRSWPSLVREDMFDRPIDRIAVAMVPWTTIERKWETGWGHWAEVFKPLLEVRQFDPPITVGDAFRLEPWKWTKTEQTASKKAE